MSCFLTYTLSITGDCSNNSQGAVTFNINGSAPTYTIVSPNSGTTTGLVSAYTETNLSAGTYNYTLTDSCSPTNNTIPITVYISSGTCVSISDIGNTTCGLSNGVLTAETTTQYGNVTFELYEVNNGLIQSVIVPQNYYTFTSLNAGIYYVIADDGGGCTGKSESCIIKSSTTLDFGFFIVNDSTCVENTGKIFVTGLTGVSPFTYLWSNGNTTSSITGLTVGSYDVTITDGVGCSVTKSDYVATVPPPNLVSFIVVPPSCYIADGEVTMTISGGTPPYYYSGSNGDIQISLSSSVTFTGVSAGFFSIYVVDAGLCTLTETTIVSVPSSFSILSVSITNSNCNDLGGKITASVLGGTPNYTYTLVDPLSNSTVVSVASPTYSFNGLSSGTYTLTIQDSAGVCSFTSAYTISNTVKFELSASTTATTCNQDDGSILLEISSGGTSPYVYSIDGVLTVTSGNLYQLFANLPAGNYTATVTDSAFCIQTLSISIPASPTVDFTLFGVDPVNGNDGVVEALITDGEPPFTLNWSSNVNGQTGLTVTTLTAGTYSLTVTDDNGCVLTRSVTLYGYAPINGSGLINFCDKNFISTGNQLIKGPKQLLLEGYYDLTSGFTNCILNQAIFEAIITLSGNTYTIPFYTGTSYNDVPSYQQWADIIYNTLSTIDGIGSISIDIPNNKISVSTDCNSEVQLSDVGFSVDMNIDYDISCVSCGDCWINKFSFKLFDISGYEIVGTFQNTNVEINGYPSFFTVIVSFAAIVYYDNILNQWVGQSYNDNFALGPSGDTPVGEWYFGDVLIGESYCGDENYCINYCIGDVCYNMSTIKYYDNVTMEYFYVLDNNTDLSIQYSSDTGNWIAFSGSTVVSEKEGNPNELPIGEWSAISIVSSFSSTTEVCELSNFCQCFNFSSSTDGNQIEYFDCNYSANTITLDSGDTINNLCVISNQNIITGDFGNEGFYRSDDDLITSLCDNTNCT